MVIGTRNKQVQTEVLPFLPRPPAEGATPQAQSGATATSAGERASQGPAPGCPWDVGSLGMPPPGVAKELPSAIGEWRPPPRQPGTPRGLDAARAAEPTRRVRSSRPPSNPPRASHLSFSGDPHHPQGPGDQRAPVTSDSPFLPRTALPLGACRLSTQTLELWPQDSCGHPPPAPGLASRFPVCTGSSPRSSVSAHRPRSRSRLSLLLSSRPARPAQQVIVECIIG